MRAHHPFVRLLVGVVAACMALVACTGDNEPEASTDDPVGDERSGQGQGAPGEDLAAGIEIIDRGIEPRVIIALGDPVIGQSWTTTVHYEQSVDQVDAADGQLASFVAMSVDLFETIIEVDGEPVLRSELVDVRMDPEMEAYLAGLGRDPREVDALLDELVGSRQDAALDGSGIAGALDQLGVDSVATATLPDGAVGEGARWSGVASGSVNGLTIEILRTFHLTSIGDETVEISFESTGGFTLADGETVEVVGEGASILDRRSLQPLESSFSLSTSGDAVVEFTQAIESLRQ